MKRLQEKKKGYCECCETKYDDLSKVGSAHYFVSISMSVLTGSYIVLTYDQRTVMTCANVSQTLFSQSKKNQNDIHDIEYLAKYSQVINFIKTVYLSVFSLVL